MNRYGEVAVSAVRSMLSGDDVHPLIAWKKAASEAFGEETWAHKKGCPKDASLAYAKKVWFKAYPLAVTPKKAAQ